jgi:hypothetical protein
MSTAYREATEAELMVLVTELATIYGWKWAHFRVARTKYGWATAVSGPLGKGFPDLVLTRDGRSCRRTVRRRLEEDQSIVLGYLGVALSTAG